MLKVKCNGCKKDMIVNSLHTWYCKECREKNDRKSNNFSYYMKRIGIGSLDIHKDCLSCNRDMLVTGNNQKYCPECSAERLRNRQRRVVERRQNARKK